MEAQRHGQRGSETIEAGLDPKVANGSGVLVYNSYNPCESSTFLAAQLPLCRAPAEAQHSQDSRELYRQVAQQADTRRFGNRTP